MIELPYSELQLMGEMATGVVESPAGIGKFYDQTGTPLTPAEAQVELTRPGGGAIAVPNAGAGSFRKVFKALGFDKIELWESGNSSGDWTFLLGAQDVWRLGQQTNRYPYFGYNYRVDPRLSFQSKEELINYLS